MEYTGFEVSLGGIADPAEIQRSYEDIEKIFKSNPGNYTVSEEKVNGHFKRYIIQT